MADSVLLAHAMQHTSDAVLITTAVPIDRPGPAIVFANNAFYRMSGYKYDEVVGKTPRFLQGELTERHELDRIRQAIADGGPVRSRLYNYRKDGTPYRVEIDIAPVYGNSRTPSHFVSVQREISDGTETGAHEQQVARRLSVLVHKALDGYALLDVRGNLVDASASGVNGLGWPTGALLGKCCLDLVHPDDQEFVQGVFREIRAVPNSSRRIDTRVNRADGSVTWIAVTLTNLLHETDVRAIVLNYRDVTNRKIPEFALQRSEERHRLLFERNPGAMWLCDPKTLGFLQVNAAAVQKCGYSDVHFARMTVLDILPLTSRGAFLAKTQNAQINFPTSLGAWSLIALDGSIIDAELYGSRLVDDSGETLLIMAVDVTQQTIAHREMASSNLRVQRLLEEEQERSEVLHALADAAIEINTCKNTEELLQRAADYARRLTHADISSVRLTVAGDRPQDFTVQSANLDRSEVVERLDVADENSSGTATRGHPLEPCETNELDASHTRESDLENLAVSPGETSSRLTVPLNDNQGEFVGKLEVLRQSGAVYSGDDKIVLIQLAQMVTGSLQNKVLVEQLTENSEELRKSEQRYALAVEGSNDGIWDWIIETDKVIRSPRFLTLLGMESNTTIETRLAWYERIHPEDRDRVGKALNDHLLYHAPYDVEMRVMTFSGEYRSFRSRGQAVWDEEGRPVRMAGSFTDLTERKALEAQLLQAQKLESIGRLAGGIAHDFNNMLTGILGFGELAQLKLDEGSTDVREDLLQIEAAALRATELTSQLLAFARKQIIAPQTTDLNDLARSTRAMLTRLIGETITLQEDLQPGIWMVNIDPGQFQQVLVNLAVNARDAMPDGGQLLIETANVVLDSDYTALHSTVQPGEYVRLAVTDTGIGMNESTKALIFEPFFTTKDRGKGTGLGLSTVYGVISQNQGHVHVYSEPGQGTTFKCYFKRAYDDTVPFKPPIEASLPVRGTERVLLVEDDSLVRQFAYSALVSGGYMVMAVDCAADALALVSSQNVPFDIVITDVVLPGMGGKDLVDHLLVLYPKLRVLFMSGYTENAIVHHGVLASGTSFLSKPFTVSSLLSKLRILLDAT
jgi:PAS domain S-box-containing protein